jgi:hypothetical protein
MSNNEVLCTLIWGGGALFEWMFLSENKQFIWANLCFGPVHVCLSCFSYDLGNPHDLGSLLEHTVVTMGTEVIIGTQCYATMTTKAIVGTHCYTTIGTNVTVGIYCCNNQSQGHYWGMLLQWELSSMLAHYNNLKSHYHNNDLQYHCCLCYSFWVRVI